MQHHDKPPVPETGHPAPPPAARLQGLKVIDLSTVAAGPLAAQILGDHGADVLKVEPPFGEIGRSMGSSWNEHGFSSHYFSMNRNKRTAALDVSRPEGKEVLLRLLESADVLVNNFKPGTMERYGLCYDAVLKDRFPRLISASVTGFGADGPLGMLPGMDPVGQAMGGFMGLQGDPDGPPTRLAIPVADLATGLYLVIGILMALHERNRSGRGQAVEATLYDRALTLSHPFAADWLMSGEEAQRIGDRHPIAAPYNVYPCRDGHILLACASDRQFRTPCHALGAPRMADDPRFSKFPERRNHHDAIDAEIDALIAGQVVFETPVKG